MAKRLFRVNQSLNESGPGKKIFSPVAKKKAAPFHPKEKIRITKRGNKNG
jgi:hypothetical protein